LILVPWLLYALGPSLSHTAQTIANQPAPASVPAFWAIVWAGLNVGQLIDLRPATPIALLALGAALGGQFADRRPPPGGLGRPRAREPLAFPSAVGVGARESQRLAPTSENRAASGGAEMAAIFFFSWLLLPLAVATVVFLAFPQFGRIRFLLFLLPPYLLLLCRPAAYVRRFAPALLALMVVLFATADIGTYVAEGRITEEDARALAEALADRASPRDLVILQAAWEIGYLRLHLPRAQPDFAALDGQEVAAALTPGDAHRVTWLAMYQTAPRDANYPLEAAFDRAGARGDARTFGPTRLIPYALATPPGRPADADFGGIFRLRGVSELPGMAQPAEALTIDLDWQALRSPGRDFASFVHLVDPTGRSWAGHDSEPQAGLDPTAGWPAGAERRDRHLLLLPPTLPPGEYQLRAGWHASGDPTPLPGAGRDFVELGHLQVRPARPAPAPALARLGEAIALERADLTPADGERFEQTLLITADGPLTLQRQNTALRPGDGLRLRLAWRALSKAGTDYTVLVHLVGASNAPLAQADGPPAAGLYPTSRWDPGDLIDEERLLGIPPDTPPGVYRVLLGLYSQPDLKRLTVRGAARGPEDTVIAGRVQIR
jgi:hypothetical protein